MCHTYSALPKIFILVTRLMHLMCKNAFLNPCTILKDTQLPGNNLFALYDFDLYFILIILWHPFRAPKTSMVHFPG